MQTDQPVKLTRKYADAVAYASTIHADQRRKGGRNAPYMTHLLGVSSLVLEAGGDEEQAIAALLHDAVEDCGGMPRAQEIREEFGDRVASIVLGCSDATDPAVKRATPYWDRKKAFLRTLTDIDRDILLVVLADKVHNARSVQTLFHSDGLEKGRGVFKATDDQMLSYYGTILQVGRQRGMPSELLTPLEHAVRQLQRQLSGEILESAAPVADPENVNGARRAYPSQPDDHQTDTDETQGVM